ncbi:hypothetical protein [Streptomyces hokutonensis]|uniref:Transposase n=1 Tax=Streptomyces hokutonensis TaxID=1306990 RepID=A0ABW6LXC5_9ACTN
MPRAYVRADAGCGDDATWPDPTRTRGAARAAVTSARPAGRRDRAPTPGGNIAEIHCQVRMLAS